ncbi:amidase family protein [Craterilacuibacter sp.]|uniref:amidase family protein n=1 Tax=Craterilacuibacter sp. TaxID=2870909 RepID=UPI003F3A9167
MAEIGDYQQHDAIALAALLRTGELSRGEVLPVCLAQLDAVNPHINALVHDMRASAIQSLDTLPDGPFTCVPFVVKALLSDCAGEPVGTGTRLLLTVRAGQDSVLVARYRQAGLVIVGRSNTPELGLTSYTEPAVTGITRNTWPLELTAKGVGRQCLSGTVSRNLLMICCMQVFGV